MLERLRRLARLLAEDADQPWRTATLRERYEENQRRLETGRLPVSGDR